MEQDDPGLEAQLERGVGTKVAERDVADDQPASRMGMIRYQKLSFRERDEAGRSRLMSFSRTVAAATASSPPSRSRNLD